MIRFSTICRIFYLYSKQFVYSSILLKRKTWVKNVLQGFLSAFCSLYYLIRFYFWNVENKGSFNFFFQFLFLVNSFLASLPKEKILFSNPTLLREKKPCWSYLVKEFLSLLLKIYFTKVATEHLLLCTQNLKHRTIVKMKILQNY